VRLSQAKRRLVLSKLASGWPAKIELRMRGTWTEELLVGFQNEAAEPVPHFIAMHHQRTLGYLHSALAESIYHEAGLIEDIRQTALVNPIAGTTVPYLLKSSRI